MSEANAEICLSITDVQQQLLVKFNNIDKDVYDFVQEFGKQCSILSAIQSFIDDIREPFEKVLKEIADIARQITNAVKAALSELKGIIEEGFQFISAFLDTVQGVINQAIGLIVGAINQMADWLAGALNQLASALCNILNLAITGIPTNVVLTQPYLIARRQIDQATDPTEFISKMLDKLGIDNLRNSLDEKMNAIRNINVPNLKIYECIPL